MEGLAFKRSATGFDSIIVLMTPPNSNSTVVDFSSKCSSIAPLLVFPPIDAFKIGMKVPDLKVYIKSMEEPNLYVFKCVA